MIEQLPHPEVQSDTLSKFASIPINGLVTVIDMAVHHFLEEPRPKYLDVASDLGEDPYISDHDIAISYNETVEAWEARAQGSTRRVIDDFSSRIAEEERPSKDLATTLSEHSSRKQAEMFAFLINRSWNEKFRQEIEAPGIVRRIVKITKELRAGIKE